MTETSQSPGWRFVPKFMRSPWWSMLGTIGTLTGLFFVLFPASPDLTYTVASSRSVVLNKRESGALQVLFNGKLVESDLSIAQVAVWNNGRRPIHEADLLQQIELRTDPPVPILELKTLKTSRDVIRFRASSDRLPEGVVPLSWKVLEHGDGGIVQVMYAGSPTHSVEVIGVVEGQNRISYAATASLVLGKQAISLSSGGGIVVAVLVSVLLLAGFGIGIRALVTGLHTAVGTVMVILLMGVMVYMAFLFLRVFALSLPTWAV